MKPLEIISPSESFTLRLGRALGERLGPNDVVALTGELGAGKTVLAKGIALGAGLANADDVVSPTFTLLNVYQGRLSLYHFDLYRLRDAAELRGESIEETCMLGGITIIEWSERAAGALPAERLEIHLSHESRTSRRILIVPYGIRMDGIVGEVACAFL